MNLREFRRAGHWPTLLSAFLYFDVSFMIWMLIGSMGGILAKDFQLSDGGKGLMVAIPTLGGACLRLVLGVMTDRLGARRTALVGMALTALPLFLGWRWVESYQQMLLVGLMLGVAGASFAAALPLASRWYPPECQGLAMGIAGAGNSGTALATFFAPKLAAAYGWHAVFGFALLPLGVVWIVFFFLAKDSPTQPAPRPLKDYGTVLSYRDTWLFCAYYAVTFGGFVGLAGYLNIFFSDQYKVTPIRAGEFATLCVIAGSCLRPVGGYLSDRFGGIRMLVILLSVVGLTMFGLSTLPVAQFLGVLLMFIALGSLGMANGAVFQLVPQRFSKEVGVVTGLVGAAGGFGGFLLPFVLGQLKGFTGNFSTGFLVFGSVAIVSSLTLFQVGRGWEQTFVGRGGKVGASNDAGSLPMPSPEMAEFPVT